MTKYEFPTEPDKDEFSLFAGAFPAHGNGGSNLINWQGCQSLSILEAAALSYGMHPYFATDYVYSENCGTLQRGLFNSTITQLIRAVFAGSIRTIEIDKPLNKTEVTMDTVVITEDVLNFFGSISDQKEIDTRQTASSNDLSETERNTMLKLIIGMAIDAYGYNPNSTRNPATGDKNGVNAKLQIQGISISDDTVRKYLTEAKKLL